MSLWGEWKPNVAGILGITFTAENTNVAKNRRCTPQKIATPFTSKVPGFIKLPTHILSLTVPPSSYMSRNQKLLANCPFPRI